MLSSGQRSSSTNPVRDILSSIPEFRHLHISTRNELANFIERKLRKFDLKIKASPYAQHGHLNVNSDFGVALATWLFQFPEEHQLGMLAAAISTTYITDDEIDSFVDIGLARLREKVIENTELDTRRSFAGHASDWPTEGTNLWCYAISEFGAYEKVLRKLSISGSRDRGNHPVRGIVDEFVKKTFQTSTNAG